MTRDARCRACSNPVGNESKRIGGKRYHDECAAKKPRSRQVWENGRWRHLGTWNDEEDATLRGNQDG